MTDKPQDLTAPAGQMLIYQTEDGRLKVEARLENETLWLTQQQMAELFQTSQQNISLHLQNIYEEGELIAEATHKDFLLVRQEGARRVSRKVDHYNLDMILSVGYRVKSAVATRFRIWATQRLHEYIVKGFVLDDERLKTWTSPLIISMSCCGAFRIFAPASGAFIKKSPTSTPPASITTPPCRRASHFSRRCKTRCTGPSGRTCARPTGFAARGLCEPGSRLRET